MCVFHTKEPKCVENTQRSHIGCVENTHGAPNIRTRIWDKFFQFLGEDWLCESLIASPLPLHTGHVHRRIVPFSWYSQIDP